MLRSKLNPDDIHLVTEVERGPLYEFQADPYWGELIGVYTEDEVDAMRSSGGYGRGFAIVIDEHGTWISALVVSS